MDNEDKTLNADWTEADDGALPIPRGSEEEKQANEEEFRTQMKAIPANTQRNQAEEIKLAEAKKELAKIVKEDAQIAKAEKAIAKAQAKKRAIQDKINKEYGSTGALEKYTRAKLKHKVATRKRQVRKWKKEDEFSPQVTYLVTKKKGKRGTSPIGNVIHKALYPMKRNKRGRW